MQKRLYINPPSLLRWQPKDQRTGVVFLDLEPDFLDENTIRIDLDIVFRPIPIKHGLFEQTDFYVGCTGAWVTFKASGGEVKNYTQEMPFEVDYEHGHRRSREPSKLVPGMEIGAYAKVQMGEFPLAACNESTFNAKFSGFERTLSATFLGDGVEWQFVPQPSQVIRDYLIGNLPLYVEAVWNRGVKAGTVELRPSDVRFFDSNHRLIGSKLYKAWLMLFVLLKGKEGQGVNSKPTIINFKEVSDG